ncbi:hypothetical protein I5H93_gp084 [Mycobacterium phage SuperGrey]|uniref:Uncharacterized protein n=1 Tax=Mycobacterium phage SuperGrey TaxID=1913038 RepID=A0A1J0GQ50_9CAUD|nr:hypothetical protein I5H93_gp084 [Mycobacterium phage SuperGrey]APC43576.1 hypothetical protein SEA_SUPERGREY_84 [Mycobacterium phage SuperGrey]QGJ93709.1 hypothetical protein SEA_HANNACONDA_68 [Mycobacterium phage Hannaconda]
MSSEAQNVIAGVVQKHQWHGGILGCGRGCDWRPSFDRTWACGEEERLSREHAAHVAEEIDKALGGLTREEQWVPVEESGHRWAGRSREAAEVNLKYFSVTGIDHDPEVDSPLVRIEHEARWVSGWGEA